MREHGVLRRALCVDTETAGRRRAGAAADLRPLHRTARLFRDFGENYHERRLEQAHIFPALQKAGRPAAALVPILIAQHDRGRAITDYILAVTRRGGLGRAEAERLARVFDAFVLMYRNHTAREDTVVFPAWKTALSGRRLDEMGDLFEDIERKQFGRDGFEDAVKQWRKSSRPSASAASRVSPLRRRLRREAYSAATRGSSANARSRAAAS